MHSVRRIATVAVCIAALGGGTALASTCDWGHSGGHSGESQYGETRGKQGCTPGFWKNHVSTWEGYSSSQKFNAVFGVSYKSSLTLGDALKLGGGGFAALARHATAALLNAAHDDVDYGLTSSEIIALVKNAFATGNSEPLKNRLDSLNNAGCSIDAHGRPIR